MRELIAPIADMIDGATLWCADSKLQRFLLDWLLGGQHLRQAEVEKGWVSTPCMAADDDLRFTIYCGAYDDGCQMGRQAG